MILSRDFNFKFCFMACYEFYEVVETLEKKLWKISISYWNSEIIDLNFLFLSFQTKNSSTKSARSSDVG